MPQFDPELIEVMKKVLEDIMTRVPLEHSTPAAKAYFAECILKAAAQGQTNYDALRHPSCADVPAGAALGITWQCSFG